MILPSIFSFHLFIHPNSMLPNRTYRSLMPSIDYAKHTRSRTLSLSLTICFSSLVFSLLLSNRPACLCLAGTGRSQPSNLLSRLVGAHSLLLLSDSHSRLLPNPLLLIWPVARHQQAGCESSSCCRRGAILGAAGQLLRIARYTSSSC